MRGSISLIAEINGRIFFTSRSCLVPKTLARTESRPIIHLEGITTALLKRVLLKNYAAANAGDSTTQQGVGAGARDCGGTDCGIHHPQRMPQESLRERRD